MSTSRDSAVVKDLHLNHNAGKTQSRDSNHSKKTSEYTTSTDRNWHGLANATRPMTPLRRASSADPLSSRGRRRTPVAQSRTPAGVSRYGGGSARKPLMVTPHGRAAQRQLEARRTPGKERRRSGRQQRETPRDALRALSRLLAPRSQPIAPTPTGPGQTPNKRFTSDDDDLDDEVELQRPRLSLPMGDADDEDDSLLLPPQSAGLEDENFTVQSVEFGRRARSEQPLSRLSRGSFGSVRMSDNFGDVSALGLGGALDESSLIGGPLADDDIYEMSEFSMGVPGDNTQTLRDLGLAQGALSIGRDSDVRPLALPDEATDNDFLFIVPPRDVSEEPRRNSSRRGSTPLSMILDMQSEDPQGHVEPLELDQENLMEGEEGEEFDNSEHPVPTVLYDPTQPLDMSLTMSVPRAPGLVGTLATTRKHKQAKVSVHGIEYPSLPAGVVKKLATTFARTAGNNKTKLNKETLDAIIQASDWFFEQVSDDLGAYAEHGRRKTIDETDVITLMARQRQINASNTPFSLAQKYLPRELLQEMRMVPPPKSKNQH